MDGNVLSSLLNPVRMRILQLFFQHETQTVKRIGEELPDIPPASLYRHVNKLVEDEVIEICAEYKIRGTVEKVYRLKNNPLSPSDDQLQEADQVELFSNFYLFTMAMLKDFNSYLSHKEYNLLQDRVKFMSTPLYLNNEECDQLLDTIQKALEKMENNKAGGDRRLRKFSFAILPEDG